MLCKKLDVSLIILLMNKTRFSYVVNLYWIQAEEKNIRKHKK